jgi:hypothetical protein
MLVVPPEPPPTDPDDPNPPLGLPKDWAMLVAVAMEPLARIITTRIVTKGFD